MSTNIIDFHENNSIDEKVGNKRLQAADFILTTTVELISIAAAAELDTLKYLLKLVELEASNCKQANQSGTPPRR